MNPNEEESVRGQGHDEELPAPTEDIPSTRLWLAPKDLSAFSSGEIALLHNMGVITEILANMATGPKSRHPSAASSQRSSMKSTVVYDNEEQINQGEDPNEGLAELVADDEVYQQFCEFINENQKGRPLTMIKRTKNTIVLAKRFRDSVENERMSNLDDDGLNDLYIQLSQKFRADQPSTSESSTEVATPRRSRRTAPKTPARTRSRRIIQEGQEDEYYEGDGGDGGDGSDGGDENDAEEG
ncbi:hypothetical protein FALBO_16081 [Fusarium albosuccineum]|uniref:Uncharacterized protein n=1 Tax=Fusarium albosuccineum TaxID=1237068 RepID=A0A8H4P0U8_9HYPO|nr:hypothetical protein FALBO_16081 [Fusarium albosuccineum]